MKLKRILTALLLAGPLVCFFAAQAGETTFRGVSVDYGDATANWVDDELVLKYTGSSTLKISEGTVEADILVVGGGGGGGRSNSNSSYYGSGNGGSVLATANQTLPDGRYEIAVGSGGSGATSNGKSGSAGRESSLKGGFVSKTAAGGAGGGTSAAAGTPTTGTESLITGSSVFYGKGGVKATDTSTAGKEGTNPGDGGTGNKRGSPGGNGAKGVVVVRLKAVYSKVATTLSDLALGEGEEVSTFTDASTGAAVDITYGNVQSIQFAPEGVARAERTRDGKLKIVWAGFGTTTATIVLVDKVAKAIITYTLHITTSSTVALQDLTIQRGETVTDFRVKSSGEAIRLEYDAVKDLNASLAGAAEVVRAENGEFGIVGKLAGVTDLMIVSAGQSYTFKVTVEKLLSGLYRAGAYEVAVTNASDVFYVDGDLVITYRDADGDTAKSFTLPKSTKARLLAIGGGGAGGTYKTPYAKSGALPGGGGAGRMIEKSDYELAAQKYVVVVGKGGTAATVNTSDAKGGDGGDTTVAGLTAKGGGGGGVKSAGNGGGSGGGGSASSLAVGNGGSAATVSTGDYGYAGGKSPSGNWHGAGGGGAGGAGGGSNTESATTVPSAWGVGGKGRTNDITGESIDYARGGDGGWLPSKGLAHTGKPGLDGRGDGGGGGCCSDYAEGGGYVTTVGGRGGNGVVIVRIPAYKMLVGDALKAAVAGLPAMVSGASVTLTGDVTGPIRVPDNLGAVTIDLNGCSITGADGAEGDDITAGGNGAPALEIVPHEYESVVNAPTVVKVTGSGSLTGGNGGTGHPAGLGAEACAGDASHFNVGSVSCERGTDGVFIEQHPHEWAYRLENGKIVATCVAPGECSYKTREPFIAVKAEDANYTSMRYDGLNAINGITPATGIVVAPEVYVGRDGTVYPASVTPPTEQGHYSAIMSFDGMSITSDFSIVELPFARTNVYSSAKTAERLGRDVRIALSASFDGAMAINNNDALFIGSCCEAHSMTAGTIEKTVNALAKYANVRWYAHNGIVTHASDPDYDGYVLMGGEIGRSIPLQSGNHCIYKKMMDDLWNELVLNVNQRTYGLIVLEFDGNLLGRIQGEAYQFVFDLPEGWNEDRVSILHDRMKRFYDANKIVWVVPSGNGGDGTATGGCPWTSQPECLWQRALFNTTEDAGFECPLQHDYENADKLTAYLKRVIVGHFFSNVEMKDKLAEGLSFKTVTPQMRNADGIWCDFNQGGTEGHYTIYEPRSGTTVTADVVTDDREVTVSFDMREEQAWACENNVMLGDEYRVVIDAEVDGSFFSGVAEGAEKSTNEGPAIFTFTEPNLQGEGDYSIVLSNDTPKVKNVLLTPEYSAGDVVKTYDGLGTNIVVTPIQPSPEDAVVRYSLDEHGPYADTLSLTEVCDKTKVWFEITDRNGDFTAVTNFACVTILPSPEPELESMGLVITPVAAYFNKDPQSITFTVTNAAGEVITPDPEKTRVYYKGPDDADWVPADEFAGISNVTKAAGSTDSNGVVTVKVKVVIEGYEEVTASSTVRVMPRVIAEQTGSATKPYDGTPLTCPDHEPDLQAATNYAYEIYHEVKHPEIYDGPPRDDWRDAIGFPPGDGLEEVPTAGSQTDVGSSPNTVNLDGVTFTDGVNKDDYALSFPTGTLTIVAATIETTPPSGAAENPGEEPQPADGVTLWAENVVKTYDGVGTNVIAGVYNAVPGNGFDIEYTTNDDLTGWVSELAFTNVVAAQKVYFRAVPQGATPNYVATNGFAYVTITNRPVTIAFAAADKVYDATTAATCASTNFANVVAGEGFALDTSSMSFSFDTPDVGSGKTVTAAGYDDSLVIPLGETLASNYAFTFVETTTAAITPAKQAVTSSPYSGVYDGEGHTIAVTQEGGTVAYWADGAWVDDAPLYTNRVEATNVVFRVTKTGHEDFVGTNTVTVAPRPVTLTSGTKTDFPYDGEPHAFTNLTATGFVAGEGLAATSGWATVTAVAEGEVDNAFSYRLGPNTQADNYTVTVVTGKLAVVPALVVPKAPSGAAENPGEEPQPADGVTLWAENVVKTYDGVGTNVIAGVYNAVPGNGFDIEYTTNDDLTGWVSELAFTNVVDGLKVYFRAVPEGTDPNYVGATNYAYVTILPRPATIAFAASDKVYDGTDAATCASTNFSNLVEGEGFALDTSSMTFAFDTPDVGSGKTVTAAGYADTLLVPLGETLASNYAFTFVPTTTASITHAKQAVTSSPYSGVYDGEGHTIAVDPDGGAVTYLVDGSWVDDAPLYTNRVESTNVVFRVAKDNYETFEGTNTVTVTPKAATLESGTKTDFVYDGEPHAFTNLTATGFVSGEGLAATSAWATVVSVAEGEVDNAFAYGLKPNTLADNYTVTVVTGKLAVVPALVVPKAPSGAAENPGEEPQPADGVTLWAENVVKTYDGVGTNVIAGVYNAVPGNGFDIEYTTNDDLTGWVSELAFTNVVAAQKVYFRAVPEGTAPNYVGATNCAYVTILPRPATISFTAADKVYDGTAAAACTSTNFSNLVAGEGFALDTSSMTFAFDTPDVGSGKTVTAAGYADTLLVPLGETLASNYAFTFVPTTTASITHAKQAVTSSPYSGVYDGEGHTIAVDPDGGAVTYLVDGSWVDDAPLYTNRVEATNVVFRVAKDNYETFEGTNTVTVAPRPAMLASGTKTDFVYDGEPHAFTNLTATGFVSGEGLAATSAWATVTDVAEGQVDNTFAYGLRPNTLADNYVITVVNGKVAVGPAPVVPKNPGDDPAENPDDEPRPGDGPALWARNVVKMYDGIPTNVVADVYNAVEGNGFVLEYSTNETDWVSDLAFTNVVDAQKVYFRAIPQGDAPNYLPTNGYAYVTITNRPVTITFAAADKVYDGNAVATCASTNFENLVAGEGFALGTSSMSFAFDTPDVGVGKTVTAAGYADSLVVPLGDTLASNYDFTFVPTTTAAITRAKQTVTSSPYSGVYDGEGHTITVDPDGGAVAYLVDGSWVDDAPLYTNRVEATNVVFRVTREGYETFEGTNTVTVTRREATLTSGTKTDFPYDGEPHACTNLAVTGFVAGEGLNSTSGWATVTDVAEGRVDNAFAYGLRPNTLADNYVITVVNGKVAVEPAPVVPKNPGGPAGNPDDEPVATEGVTLWAENIVKVYDGLGTNVVPLVYNAVAGNSFAYEYSTNEVDWAPELAFTNVTEGAQKVYFRAIPQGDAPNYLAATNYAYVTITKAVLTVTANDQEIVFGTDVPGTSFYDFACSGFTNGEDRTVLEAEPTFGSAYTATTPVGTLGITNETPGVARNYEFIYVHGTLTVTKDRGYVGPIDSKTYKGAPWEPDVTVTNAAGDVLVEGSDYTVAYHDNVHATNLAYAVVTFAGNYGGVVTNYFAILPRPVTLVSGTETFTYDGNSHSNVGVTVTSGSFVPGEGVTTNGFAEVRDVCAGVDNAFAYDFLVGTLAADYDITVEKGELAVEPAPVLPKKPDDPAANPGGRPKPAEGVTLWAENVVKVYDGLGTNVVADVYNEVEGNGFTFLYSTNNVDFVAWNELQFTNVVEAQKVYFRAIPQGETPNYLPTNGCAYVTITKAVLTVTANDQEIVFGTDVPGASFYDFACSGFTNGEDRTVLEVEPTFGSAYTATTPVGTLGITNETPGVARNYELVYVDGTLTVTKDRGYVGPIDSKTYRGAPWEPDVTVTNAAGDVLVEGTDYTVSYHDNVHATNLAYAVVEFMGNYGGVVTNYFAILPRRMTLVSGTETFTYDGNAHSNVEVTVASGSFVPGEGVATNGFTEVRDVCAGVDNAFGYDFLDGTLAADYDITVEKGELAVVPAPVVPKKPDDPAANPGDRPKPAEGVTLWAENVVKVYDGAGTNVVPLVYNAVAGNSFAYEYSTNEVDWTSDLAFTNATEGAQKVYFRAIPQGANYLPTNGYAFVTITQRVVTVKADNKTKDPGGADPVLTCTTNGLIKASDMIAGGLMREQGENPGTYGIVEDTPFDAGLNYTVIFIPATLTINDRVPLKIYVADATVTYGAAVPTTLGFKTGAARYDRNDVDTSKISGLNTVSFGTTYTRGSPVSGSPYSINTNSTALTSGYYAITVVPGKLTVNQKSVTVTAPKWNRTVDTIPTETEIREAVTMTGLVDSGDRADIAYTVTFDYDGGSGKTYPIDLSGSASQGNYRVTFVDGSVFVEDDGDAMLEGNLGWAFDQGTGVYYARFRVRCTEKLENLVKNSIRFVFADRMDGSTVKAKLVSWNSSTSKNAEAPTVTYNKTAFRYFALNGNLITALNRWVTYGPECVQPVATYPTFRSAVAVVDRVGTFALYVNTGSYPANVNAAVAQVRDFTGYLVWRTTKGRTMARPIVAGEVAGQAIEVGNRQSVVLTNGPLSASALNEVIAENTAYGVDMSDGVNPVCEITTFKVSGTTISGTIRTVKRYVKGVPGDNATVLVYGVKNLGEKFVKLGEVTPKRGVFSYTLTRKQTGYRFFKIILGVKFVNEVYK